MFKQLMREDLQQFVGYRSARSSNVVTPIMLNANELPWSSDERALNRYPQPQPAKVLTTLSEYYQINPGQLLLTRGSDEAIDLLVRLMCAADRDQVMMCPPTYGMYAVSAALQGAAVIEVPLIAENNFQLDVGAIIEACKSAVKIVFLCSPNNPTGNLLATQDIHTLCTTLAEKAIVVVDEAYLEFAQTSSMTQYIDQFDNLVVLRTLSKAFGLAAVRCGVLISNACNIDVIRKILAPYPLAAMMEEIVCQRFAQMDQMRANIATILAERQRVSQILSRQSCIVSVFPSDANFIAFQANDPDQFYQNCLRSGIVVRQFTDYLRVTIGAPDENDRFIEVVQQKEV